MTQFWCVQSLRRSHFLLIRRQKHALNWKEIQDAAKAEEAEAQERRLKAALSAKREPSGASGIASAESSTNSPSLPSEDTSATVQAENLDVAMASGEQLDDEHKSLQASQVRVLV